MKPNCSARAELALVDDDDIIGCRGTFGPWHQDHDGRASGTPHQLSEDGQRCGDRGLELRGATPDPRLPVPDVHVYPQLPVVIQVRAAMAAPGSVGVPGLVPRIPGEAHVHGRPPPFGRSLLPDVGGDGRAATHRVRHGLQVSGRCRSLLTAIFGDASVSVKDIRASSRLRHGMFTGAAWSGRVFPRPSPGRVVLTLTVWHSRGYPVSTHRPRVLRHKRRNGHGEGLQFAAPRGPDRREGERRRRDDLFGPRDPRHGEGEARGGHRRGRGPGPVRGREPRPPRRRGRRQGHLLQVRRHRGQGQGEEYLILSARDVLAVVGK